jgi:RNA polymerase sigma-70 factor (ECF subfamily)
VVTGGRDNAIEVRPSNDDAEDEVRLGFDDFVRMQYRALVKFLCRRNSKEDAEEIAQESIISLLGYRQKGTVSDWRPLLYRIAVNHSIKRARREAPHRNGAGIDIEYVADDAPSPQEQAEQAQRAERLQAAILGLPPKCRKVYLLRHGYGLSHVQIAKRCGISVKMVEKHLATAVLHLQRKVGFLRDEDL